jgi:hypothetical protein
MEIGTLCPLAGCVMAVLAYGGGLLLSSPRRIPHWSGFLGSCFAGWVLGSGCAQAYTLWLQPIKISQVTVVGTLVLIAFGVEGLRRSCAKPSEAQGEPSIRSESQAGTR